MNEDIRRLFTAANNFTYLNSAAVSPLPKTAIDAVNFQLNDVAGYGSERFPDWVETKNRTRSLIAQMLNVKKEQIAFMRNTSDGFATIANGIEWAKGDNIVSFEREFPANFYPWRYARDRFDVELRLCPEREGRIDLDEFISLIDSKTKLVAISAVQFASGFKADLERIGKAARSVDALFAVDVIQGLGAMGFDLPAQYVDIASGASHKWLCAPEGCGILYISDRARERVAPSMVGWISVGKPWDFDDTEQDYKANALAWETGTGTSSLFYGLEQSATLLLDVGLGKIDEYLLGLTDHLCERLGEKDYEVISSRLPGEASAIVSISHRGGIESETVYESLKSKNIIVSARSGRLRISPHFYNNVGDIDRLVDNLP